jgi:hypothetical protein
MEGGRRLALFWSVNRISLGTFIFALALTFLLEGCGNFQSRFKKTSANEIHGSWEKSVNEGVQYTHITADALIKDGPVLLERAPKDVEGFCPAYNFLDHNGRIAFWVGLISAMSDRESSFDPHSKFIEKMVDASGNPVVSRGLLQLSVEDGHTYGCDVETISDLENAESNLRCGVRILNQLVAEDGSIGGFSGRWLGGARYWSVLRPGAPQAEIIKTTQALSVCHLD